MGSLCPVYWLHCALLNQESSMVAKSTVGQYLVDRLGETGVGHVFGVPGDFVLGLMDVLDKSPQLHVIGTCNELNAGYAADAYARIRGIGAICVTYNVGGLSAVNAVMGSYSESVPVIVISGAPPRNWRRSSVIVHHTAGNLMVQQRVFEQVTAFSTALLDPTTAPAQIDEAIAICFREKKPVYIEIPTDVVHAVCSAPGSRLDSRPRFETDKIALEEALGEANELIRRAKHPVILAGMELDRFGLREQFRKFVEKSKLPYATAMAAKALLSEDNPQFIGTYAGSLFNTCARERVERSDCIINLGLRLSDLDVMNTGATGFPGLQACHGFVRIKHHIYEKIGLPEFVQGLVASIAPRLVAIPEESPCVDASDVHWNTRREKLCVSSHPVAETSVQKLKLSKVYEHLSELTADQGERLMLITDVGDSMFFAADLPISEAGSFICQSLYSSIGYSLPATLGAALAAPGRRLLTLIGDGAFQMTCQELSTIIRNRLNPIFILINNDGYTIERMIHEGPYNDIQPWKYAHLPAIFGPCLSARASTEEEFVDALKKARENSSTPSFVEIQCDRLDHSRALERLGNGVRVSSDRRK